MKINVFKHQEMIKFFRNIRQTENLSPTLKGGFSKHIISHISADIPLGIEGERKGKK